jgi:hypothetical protein
MVCMGSTTKLTGSATAATTTPWFSATPTVASVSSTGLVTSVSAGTSEITYTNNVGCTITAIVTVNEIPIISGTLMVCMGATTQLTGSGTAAVITPWVSATKSVATVSTEGLVTGVAAGSSIITYTNSGGCKKTATVTVSVVPAQPGAFTASTAAVIPGATSYTYTVPSVSGVTYSWSFSGTGATITGATNSAGVVYSTTATLGTLGVTATNTSGCASIARTLAITGLKSLYIPVGITQGAVELQTAKIDVTILENELNVYPNPTSGIAIFEFRIDENARVKLDIFSLNGKHIDRIFNADALAGIIQTVRFDHSLPTGIYPCVLRWKGRMISIKLVIKK